METNWTPTYVTETSTMDAATYGQSIVRISSDEKGAITVSRVDPKDIYIEPEIKKHLDFSPGFLVVILILAVLMCYGAYKILERDAELKKADRVEQVEWSAQERCSVLFNKECGCVETPTEEWQENFRC